MSTIPTNVILIWTGTHASIPSGWSRETTLDDKFAKGWGDAVAPNETGGAATHTHTSPTHTHEIAAHTHSFTLNGVANNWRGRSGMDGIEHDHSHGAADSGAASGGTSGTTEVTYSAVSNDPPYRKVIFIKANAGAQLATNTVALWGDSDTAPSNWSKVTELDGRYLKGAGTDADSDLTTDNGSTSNVHTYDHSHTAASHTHANATSAASSNAGGSNRWTGSNEAQVSKNHTHTVSFAAGTQNIADYTATPSAQSETVEPAYKRLHAIKKGASGLKEKGIIGMWLGSSTAIPPGWSLYTSMKDKHLKIGDPTTSDTGGSNTHTHAAQGHVHAGSGTHTHTGTASAHSATTASDRTDQNADTLTAGNDHTVSVDSPSTSTASTNITADESSNEPEYRTVAFIKFEREAGGGAMLLFTQMI